MYLSRRNLLQKADFNKLSREDASGEQLSDVLIHVSWESIGRAKFLIRNLILSLLDMFLDRCHIWCHSVAFCLRREGISIRQLCTIQLLSSMCSHRAVTSSSGTYYHAENRHDYVHDPVNYVFVVQNISHKVLVGN